MGWDDDDLPAPTGPEGGKPAPGKPLPEFAPPRRRSRFGLRHLMVVVAGSALVFLLARKFLDSGATVDGLVLAIVVGFLFELGGAWLLWRIEGGAGWGWSLLVIGYMLTTAALFNIAAVVSWPVLVVALILVERRKRQNEQDALVGVIAIAAGRQMPLAPGVEAFAEQSSGSSRRWSRSLANLLNQGWTLADAVESLPHTVSRTARVLIRAGTELGTLGPALREVATNRERHQSVVRVVVGRITYLLWITIMGQGIVGFMAFFIVPKFEAIFKDFGIALPGPTMMMVQVSHELPLFLTIISSAEFLFLVFLGLEMSGRGFGLFSPFAWLTRRRDAALVLRALALAVEAGQPIDPTTEALAETYPSASVRRRLRAAGRDLADGVPWVDALRDAGLVNRSEAGVLDAASRAGNLAWALREVASMGERRWVDRIQVGSQLAFFVMILGVGGLVFLIAVSYFLPLIDLISKLGR